MVHFLHNMVRRLTGVLVEVGRGRFAPETVRDILHDKDRSRGGPCLPYIVDMGLEKAAITNKFFQKMMYC